MNSLSPALYAAAAAIVGFTATLAAARRARRHQRRAQLLARVKRSRADAPPRRDLTWRCASERSRHLAGTLTAAALRGRNDAAYDVKLASALDALGRSVRSGASLPHAVAEASTSVRGGVAGDLARVAASAARGQPFADALSEWRSGRDRPSVRLSVGALALATQTGGPPARVIEEVAAAIRVRQQVAGEAHALAAQARLSAVVVGLSPLGFMAVMFITDPRTIRTLFATPIGLTCLAAGLTLDAIGAAWMHRMSNSVMQ